MMFGLRVLGRVQVTRDGETVQGFESRKALALLCYLALNSQPIPRTCLTDLFWTDKSEARGRGNLSRVLHNLSHLLPGSLEIDRDYVQLDRATFSLDAIAFEGLSARGDAESLTAAVDLYRGELMLGIQLDDCPDFEIWLVTERERWHQKVASALECLAGYHTRNGEFQKGLRFASRLLALDPWREEAHRQLMLLLSLTAQRTAALAQYDACRRILAQELGVEPSAETTALYEQIRAGAGPVRDQPRSVPLISRALPPQTNLPVPLTSFIGRAGELAAIGARLSNPGCRLLTLVGAGGMGKTSLSLRAASNELDAFRDGVFFVPLSSVGSPEFIVSAIAEAIKFKFGGTGELKDQLLTYLREKQMLLVMDNFEHLLEGANQVDEILQGGPQIKILATSREPLSLQAEWLYHVQGLPFPNGTEAQAAEPYAAVELFLDRAAMRDESFSLTAATNPGVFRICRSVEGMPLAIELAAAWIGQFSVDEIAQAIRQNSDFLTTTLRDVPPRHRSLRAVLDWSHALLSDAEQELLRRLSVFAGGWTLDAAEAVTTNSSHVANEGIGNLAEAISPVARHLQPDTLGRLVDKSLVRLSEGKRGGRYDFLEPIREYARAKLGEAGESELFRSRHYAYYAQMAEAAEAGLQGAEQPALLKQLEGEYDNLRAALRWAFEQADPIPGMQLASALWRFWYMRSHILEGEQWLMQALARSQAAGIESRTLDEYRARTLTGLGTMAWRKGDYERAASLHRQALEQYRQNGDERGAAFALHNIGVQLFQTESYEDAATYFYESLAVAERVKDYSVESQARCGLGMISMERGRLAQAALDFGGSLDLARAAGNKHIQIMPLHDLAEASLMQGDLEIAAAYFHDSLRISQELESSTMAAVNLLYLGFVQYLQREPREAKQQVRQALGMLRELGDKLFIAECLDVLGMIGSEEDKPSKGAVLLSAAESLRSDLGVPLPRSFHPRLDRALALIADTLGQAALVSAQEQGRRMALSEAIDLAMEE